MLAPPELEVDGANPREGSSEESDAAPAGAALSEESEEDAGSDAEDVFELGACDDSALEKDYQNNFLYRWLRAVQELRGHLRDDVLLPLHPDQGVAGQVWTDVDKAVVLPSWHCAFGKCTAASKGWSEGSSHEAGLWDHVWTAHRDILTSIMRKYDLRSPFEGDPISEEVAFALYNEGLAEQERQCCPRLGIATDRRALLHLGETFKEENVTTLMCYVCGCKKMCHKGFGKFGNPQQKGDISYRCDEKLLREKLLKHTDENTFWKHNSSHKRFKAQHGDAVRSDDGMREDCYEWKRKIDNRGSIDEALCCPEDVSKSPHCSHDETFICAKCRIPVCNECWAATLKSELIPKALANDNSWRFAYPQQPIRKRSAVECCCGGFARVGGRIRRKRRIIARVRGQFSSVLSGGVEELRPKVAIVCQFAYGRKASRIISATCIHAYLR